MKAMVSIPFNVAAINAIAQDLMHAFPPRQPKLPSKLFDPMRADGTFPFEYRDHTKTDVAATIARVRAEIANGERKL